MKLLKKIILLLIGFFNFSFAQGEGALPSTLFQQSPLLLGAGQIGAAIPNDDVLGFYYNPAILGYSARNNHASFSVMPDKTEWFFTHNMTYHNYGINLGCNLATSNLKLPISIGFGYLHNKFNYGEFAVISEHSPEVIGTFESYDLFDCFSLGVGIDYYLKLNLGISLKSFESKLSYTFEIENPTTAEGTMFDYGTLLIFPISDLLMKNINYRLDESTLLKPVANFSLGYSLTNFGDEIYYVDPAQSDPLLRTARLGYTFDIGADIFFKDTQLNLFKYSFTAEAEDILINQINNFTDFEYQSALGDINISDHLFNLKSDNKVIIHKGHIFRFFDTAILTLGNFDGRGYSSPRETDGLGFSSIGIFKLLNNQIQETTINYILEHFVIEYFNSNINFYNRYITNFDGLSIHFKGFKL